MKISTRIERYARLVQNLAVIFGIFGALFALLTSQFDKRVGRTLELYKDYSQAVRKDALDLDLRWAQFAVEHPNLFEKKIEEQQILVTSFFDSAERRLALINLTTFYDTLFICVQNGACDRNTAIELFGSTAKSTFEISGHYIETTRKAHRSNAFGWGLEQMYRLRKEGLFSRYI